jgi:predicted nucleic acid-binding protein
MTNSVVCADANLTLKLFLNEPDSLKARALWEEWNAQQVAVIAPMLWGYEVTAVIRNQVHRGKLLAKLEAEMFAALHQLPVQLMQPDGLHQHAWKLAQHFNRPTAYDSHYLALAEMVGCPFWTADERLFNAVQSELAWVYWLGNHQSK